MNLYEQINARYGFSVPEEYRKMVVQNWISSDSSNPDLLRIYDVEWLPLAEIASFEFQVEQKRKIVPFALSGGGDFWCWLPELSSNLGTPVVFCPRDDSMAQVFAPNFLSCLFRCILEEASGPWFTNEIDAKESFDLYCRIIAPLVPPQWAELICQLKERPAGLNRWGKGLVFIPEAEAQTIIERELSFPHLDEKFEWMTI